MYHISNYDFDIDRSKIAQYPHNPPDECKMMYIFKNWWVLSIEDRVFLDFSNIIEKWTKIFFNNSKVIKSRISLNHFTIKNNFWEQIYINNWEIFFLKLEWEDTFEALVKPWKKLKTWTEIFLDWEKFFEILWNSTNWRIIKFHKNIFEIMDELWKMPIPPYIDYDESKEELYQPIFAQKSWSVASPTASLHFTERVFQNLKSNNINISNICLHIWLWTFKTVNTDNIKDYKIHWEIVEIDISIFEEIYNLKLNNNNIIAVWTTVTRTLESLPYLFYLCKDKLSFLDENIKDFWWNLKTDYNEKSQMYINNLKFVWDKITFECKLYIYPWFEFKIIDSLLTNFHLPKSSLLMLVAAFMWYNNMKACYEHALKQDYKFFSFWDCMLIEK